MSTTLKLTLDDELREFIDQNFGDGTPYFSPSVAAIFVAS
jgi:hypothetical protein